MIPSRMNYPAPSSGVSLGSRILTRPKGRGIRPEEIKRLAWSDPDRDRKRPWGVSLDPLNDLKSGGRRRHCGDLVDLQFEGRLIERRDGHPFGDLADQPALLGGFAV